MTKSELIALLAADPAVIGNHLTARDVDDAVNSILNAMTAALAQGADTEGDNDCSEKIITNIHSSQDACSTQHGRDKHYHAFPVSFVDNKPSKHLEQKSKYKRKRGHPTDICP